MLAPSERLPNKVGGKSIEMAHWGAALEKRRKFTDVLKKRIQGQEMVLSPELGPILPVVPPLMKGEAAISADSISRIKVMTFTSKMSCASFSLAAGPMASKGTCLQADLSVEEFVKRSADVEREGGFTDAATVAQIGHRGPTGKKSIDSSHVPGLFICDLCYAGKGNYARLDSVQIYQIAHRIWVDRALERGSFVQEMTAAIKNLLANDKLMRENLASSSHFRIHDSGDFFSIPYMLGWFEVCRQLPDIQFWCPTRMWPAPQFRAVMKGVPRNLALRPSALVYGVSAPMVQGLAAGSTSSPGALAARGHWDCPAYMSLEGSCAGSCCRTCWDRPEVPVNYLVH
jgi:hypothetical protein